MLIDFNKFLVLKNSVFRGLLIYYGLGISTAAKCCKLLGISKELLIEELTVDKQVRLKSLLSIKFVLDVKLKNKQDSYLRKILSNGSFRGIRLVKGLPVRGQGTRSNGRTAKRRKSIYTSMNVKQDSDN